VFQRLKTRFGFVLRFIGYSLVVTTIIYNTVHITLIIAHKIKSCIPACTRHCYVTDLNNGCLDNGFTISFLTTDLKNRNYKSLTKSHSQYHCTTAHIKSSIHTLILHRSNSNSSSTLNTALNSDLLNCQLNPAVISATQRRPIYD
jgi:hypothetical protein